MAQPVRSPPAEPERPAPVRPVSQLTLDAGAYDATAPTDADARPAAPKSRFRVVAKTHGQLRLIKLDNAALVADAQIPLAILEPGGKLTRPEHFLRGYPYPVGTDVRLVDAAGGWPKSLVLATNRELTAYQNEAATVRWDGSGWKVVGKPALLYDQIGLLAWPGKRLLALQQRLENRRGRSLGHCRDQARKRAAPHGVEGRSGQAIATT